MAHRIRDIPALAVVALLLLPVVASAQTRGDILRSTGEYEVWLCTVASGDSISPYVQLDTDVETVAAYIPELGSSVGVAIEASVDTTRSSTFAYKTFVPVYTTGAALDSIAATTSGYFIDLTSKVKGAQAIRFHLGYNATFTTSAARYVYVVVRKRP